MDADIQFGDVEEERPRVMRRPDENHHFCVMTCGALRDGDLPIYVDLDTMLEMEAHALSNTGVELGGVLLGGQYIDEQGQAFVVVNDCLRAEHYESTKGSFKFTHDTWSDITRRLEEFPEDVRMVGWYHTHPDWGVFLSGMDLFICENFFNKRLDLALVIDPCRGDRGWFRWVANKRDPQRTGGFHLTASRFREEELGYFAQVLEGSIQMPALRSSSPATSGGYGAPVVNVMNDKNPWPQIAIIGMLAMQTLLIAMLAFGSLNSRGGDERLVALLEKERLKADIAAKQSALDELMVRIDAAPEGFVTKVSEQITELRSKEKALTSASNLQSHEIAKLSDQLKQASEEQVKLGGERDDLKKKNARLDEQLTSLEKTIAATEKGGSSSNVLLKSPWVWATVLLGLTSAIFGFLLLRRREPGIDDVLPESSPYFSPRDKNKNPGDSANDMDGAE